MTGALATESPLQDLDAIIRSRTPLIAVESNEEPQVVSLVRQIGLKRVRLVHANDSRRELGSRIDRHAAIGGGEIGLEGFRLLVNDARIDAPIVLETPKEDDMDRVNLAALRSVEENGTCKP